MTTIEVKLNSDRTLDIKNRQFAGVQGDVASTQIKFDISDVTVASGTKWSLEWWYGGTKDSTVTLTPTNNILTATIPRGVAQAGGNVECYLHEDVYTTTGGTETLSYRACRYPLRLYFLNKPNENSNIAIDEMLRDENGIYLTIVNLKTQITNTKTEIDGVVEGLQGDYAEFTEGVNDSITEMQGDIEEFDSGKQDRFKLEGGYGLQFLPTENNGEPPTLSAMIGDDTLDYSTTTDEFYYGGLIVNTNVIATKAFVRAVNDLANYYLKTEIYNKSEVNQLIGAIPKFKIEVVNQLPTTDISTTTVYLVRTGAESQNLYTEYIYVNNVWEKLGTQTVDLTGYATQTWVNSQIADFLTADEISYAISTALNNYYNKSEIDDLLDYKVNIGTFNDLAAAVEDKVDKETGKGLSTNDFTDSYKSKIETNEYNDIFNIRVHWDRSYMPDVELIRIYYQYYESGRLAEDAASYSVNDIANGNVYLYRNTGDSWQIAVGTPPSSYHRLPMLVGKIATKTVNGESVKLFFRNGDDEAQFDRLNNEKVDKKTWSTLLTATTAEAAVFQLDDTSVGVDLNSYDEIQIIFELPNNVTAFFHNYWEYENTYNIKVVGSVSSMEMRYIVVKVKKEYGIWWIENTLGIQYDRLATHWKTVYRQGISNLVFSSFEGMRFALSTTNVLPTGTNVRVRGLK